MSKYIPDPSTRGTALRVEEVEALIAARGKPLTNARALDHFLHRVLATMSAYKAEFSTLHRQVTQITAERQATGVASTLDPADSFKYMSLEEMAKHVEPHLRSQLTRLAGMVREVDQARRVARARLAAFDAATQAIAEDPNLPQEAKDRVLRLLRQVPSASQLEDHPKDLVNNLRDQLVSQGELTADGHTADGHTAPGSAPASPTPAAPMPSAPMPSASSPSTAPPAPAGGGWGVPGSASPTAPAAPAPPSNADAAAPAGQLDDLFA